MEINQEMKLRGSSWDKITITYAFKSNGVSGKNIQEIAVENNEDVLDTFFRILLENNGNVKIIGHDMAREGLFSFEEAIRKMTSFPVQPPTGIDYVIVNGYLVINEGVHTGNLKGKLLKRKC